MPRAWTAPTYANVVVLGLAWHAYLTKAPDYVIWVLLVLSIGLEVYAWYLWLAPDK